MSVSRISYCGCVLRNLTVLRALPAFMGAAAQCDCVARC